MKFHWLRVCFAAAMVLAAQNVNAQPPERTCPAGEAVQALDVAGRITACVPVPPPVNLAPLLAADQQLQTNINNEAAARAGMDATLLDAINTEAEARKAADDELRATINESSIVGSYTFSGTQSCINSTFGFNDDFTPKGTTDPIRAAVVSQLTSVTTGTRTFNADGTGSAQFRTRSIFFPGTFMTSTGFTGVTTNGLGRPGGSASVAVQSGTFTWTLVDGKLTIDDSDEVSGTIIAGPSAGCSVRNVGIPPAVGIVGKDAKTITIQHEDFAVETGITTCPNGSVFSNPRICQRERLLRKM